MYRSLLIATLVVLYFFSTAVYADWPDTCDSSQRENPSNPHSPCKWVPDSTITSAKYVVEMEYPVCRHYIYLEGLEYLPPGGLGYLSSVGGVQGLTYDTARWNLSDVASTSSLHYQSLKWEKLEDGRIRLSTVSENDFTVNGVINQLIFRVTPVTSANFYAKIPNATGGHYLVSIGELSRITNLNSYTVLAWSCYERLQTEKQRLDQLDQLEAERIELEQQLLIHAEKEQARLEAETIRLAQEKDNAQKRLETTKQVSAEIDAASAAWLVELQSIRALEKQIQDELNARTLAAIESARLLKDEYIAIKTLQLEETSRRTRLLSEWYSEALSSWLDFEDLANRTWAEIAKNENEIERVKGEIETIQDSFDQTLVEIQQRIEQFNLEQQESEN